MARLGEKNHLSLLASHLKHTNPKVRCGTACLLWTLAEPKTLAMIEKALSEETIDGYLFILLAKARAAIYEKIHKGRAALEKK